MDTALPNMSTPLMCTFHGHIATTIDAAILFEACLIGRLSHVPRRPHDRERQDLIASGNVFIYEEHASGIKRWTDGVSWSPSRILGNFLIYRELEKPFPPGEKKRALKKKKHSNGGINRPDRNNQHQNHNAAYAAVNNMGPGQMTDPERSLVGSLIDSYPFKQGGLIKKTISIHFNGVPHHLVSYYSLDDALSGSMNTPSEDPRFVDIHPRPELLFNQNFRNPLDETAIIAHEDRGMMPMTAGPFYTLAAPVQDLSPHGGVMISQSMAVAGMPSQQPMPAGYPAGLDYNFLSAQQQVPHPHQALTHHTHPHHQSQPQHHQYQYQPQQHQHHHHLQHQLQQPVHHHEDHQHDDFQRDEYQRDDYQRHFHEMQQQPLQNQHPSPQEQAGQEPQQQQQQPPSGFAPQGQWGGGYDYYFS